MPLINHRQRASHEVRAWVANNRVNMTRHISGAYSIQFGMQGEILSITIMLNVPIFIYCPAIINKYRDTHVSPSGQEHVVLWCLLMIINIIILLLYHVTVSL